MLIVNVVDLLRRPGSRRPFEGSVAVAEPLVMLDVSVPAGSLISVDLVVESMSDGASVVGTVRAPWAGECMRCLQPAGGVLVADVRELYQQRPTTDESFEFDGEHIDLEPMARQSVMLELPVAPLCRPNCAGLCAICGANRNDAPCTCTTAPVDVRWSALDELRAQFPD